MPIDDAMPVRIDASGDDPDEAAALLTRLYGAALRVRASDQPFRYRYAAVGDDTMTLRSATFTGRLEGDLPPSDEVIVQWLQAGSSRLDTGQDVLEMVHGIPVPLLPHRSFSFEMADYEQRLVHLSRDVVTRVAQEQGADVSGGVVFDHTLVPSGHSVRTWHNTVSLVSHTMRQGGSGLLLRAEMARLVSASLLEMYPQRSAAGAAVTAARSAHVRVALAYVHEHAHASISTTTLAAHVGVSLRALQEAFQRDLHTTPNGYIRSVRLDRVRDELRLADPASTTVGAIAAVWGFANLGRFAQQYRETYGESPRDTLQRR